MTTVEVLYDFVVKVGFSDGSEREVDLEPHLWGPMFEPLKADAELFGDVRVDPEAGTIVWPNGADIDPVVLHGSAEPAPRTNGGD